MKKQLINLNPIKEQVRAKLLEKYDNTTYMNTSTVNIQLDVREILEQYIADKQLVEPTVYITVEAFIKMRTLVDNTDTEIGWYGIVKKYPGLQETYVIEDIIVYPQRVTGATCEQDDNKIFEFEMSLTDEQVNNKRFQGHSHVNMGVTPSGVDEAFYQDLLSQVTDYFIITVTNKRNEYTTRFYDIANNILYSDVPIQVLLDNGTDIKTWYAEAEKQITKPVTTTTSIKSTPLTGKTYNSSKSVYSDHSNVSDDYWDQMVMDPDLGYVTKWESEVYNYKEIKPKGKKGKKYANHIF